MTKTGDNQADKRPDRREQILSAALELFTQHGMANVSTRQIAQMVGISQPSLYAHFASADAIASELCVRGFQQLHAAFDAIMAQGGAAPERLMQLGQAYIDFALEHPDIYRIAFMVELHDCGHDKAKDPEFDEGMRTFAVLRDVVAEALGTEGGEVDIQAQSCWAGVHGLASLLLARGHFPWAERDSLIAGHLRNIARAITGPR